MRLKFIQHVDFRKSEKTNFLMLQKAGSLPNLGKNDVILLVSKSENQAVFVYNIDNFNVRVSRRGKEKTINICRSERFRIEGCRWDPRMISFYADKVGIKIDGLKRYEWYLKDRLKAA